MGATSSSSSNTSSPKKAHRLESTSMHIEHVIIARAILAALLGKHHDLVSSILKEKLILGVPAIHPRTLYGRGMMFCGFGPEAT